MQFISDKARPERLPAREEKGFKVRVVGRGSNM